jgi:medium-chain acyl-[acyl-carrier-protein] hydrolase
MSHPPACAPPSASPRLTLFCLAHAGGGAQPFRRWNAALSACARVVPLELPGHGSRFHEPVLDTLGLMVAELLREVRTASPGRYAIFGHSLGALLGYELARALVAAGHAPPEALLVAARNGPAEPLSHRPIHALPDQAFLAALERLGGIPQAVVDHPGLTRAYLPVLRADLRVAETYAPRSGPPGDFPIAAFAGRRDPLTDPQAVLGWARETTAAFELALVPGGHFFLDGPDFPAALAGYLSRLAGLPPWTPGTAAALGPPEQGYPVAGGSRAPVR